MLRFEGTFTALVTPFKDDLSVDWEAFDKLVDDQLAGGVQGLVPCGTTGESPALDHEEQIELVKRCVKAVKAHANKAMVLAGTGTNATRTTIKYSQAALKAGADAVMVVVPYYNKPTQEGLRQHYVEVAKAVEAPVLVYNVPGRTGSDLQAETLARICEGADNVVSVKEATGNVLRTQEILRLLGGRVSVLSGDDALMLPIVSVGGRGVISVTSNVYPADVARVTKLALDGRFEEARTGHLALCGIHDAMFVESNPAPAKAALAHLGKMKELVRGPLAPISAAAREKVLAAMTKYAR